jgi:hypothetical protein
MLGDFDKKGIVDNVMLQKYLDNQLTLEENVVKNSEEF